MRTRWTLHALLFAGLAAFSCAGSRQEPPQRPPRLVILHTNDFHGQVYPSKGKGGLAALSAHLKRLRAEETANGARVFIVDCGDFFQGTPEGDLTEGRLMIDAFNEIGYDALCVGNHDFDFGPHIPAALAKRAKFPLLAANVLGEDERIPEYLKPKASFPNAQVEFLGLLTSDMPTVTVERARVGLHFPFEKETLEKLLPDCRNRVVVLSHVGHEREKEMAKSHPVAAWIGGHSHKKIQERCGSTLYSQAGCRGECVGVVEIGETTIGRLEEVSVKDGEDPRMKEILAQYAPEIDRIMNEPIGEIVDDCTREGEGSSPLGNWLCDLMREATGAEIALHNRTGIRADLQKGPVRLRDLYQVSPFHNTLVTMKLSGREVLGILKQMQGPPVHWLEVSGIDLDLALTRVAVAGNPIEPDREYRVVTNSFLAKGGDGFKLFQTGREWKDTLVDLLEVHKEAVRKGSPVRLSFEQRIHAE